MSSSTGTPANVSAGAYTGVSALIVILILAGLIIFVIMSPSATPKPTPSPTPTPPRPPPRPRTNFLISNYHPNHCLRVDILTKCGEQITLVNSIPPLSAGGLTKEQVIHHLQPGNIFRFYLLLPSGYSHISDYLINPDVLCPNDRIKNLHVGMITTRFIGSTDGLRMSTTAANAIQGNAWLTIHNLTNLPICLNGHLGKDLAITVDPHSTYRYLGYLHQGVTLGTVFKDNDGIYPDFQYLQPHTDLYYGLTSDIRQPLYGCFQTEFNDDCGYGQTLWPFEEGIL